MTGRTVEQQGGGGLGAESLCGGEPPNQKHRGGYVKEHESSIV